MGIGDWGLGPIPNPQSPKFNDIKKIKKGYFQNNKIYKFKI